MPTLSIVLPLHRQLLDCFLQIQDDDSATVNNMETDGCRPDSKTVMPMKATVLDPRYKSMPFLSDENTFAIYNLIITDLSNLPAKDVRMETQPGEPLPQPPATLVAVPESLLVLTPQQMNTK